MRKSTARKIAWSAVIVYLGLVYSTLTRAPEVWDWIQEVSRVDVVKVIYSLGVVSVVAVFSYMLLVKRNKSLLSYVLFAAFCCIFFVLNKLAIRPAEKIHFIEYLILSVLVYNALRMDLDRFGLKLYVFGILFCVFAGVLDEFIQLYLPGRVFDINDIIMNCASSITGFGIIRFNILLRPKPFTNPLLK